MNWQKGQPTAGLHRSSAELQNLEQRLAALERVIKIDPSGNVVIQANTGVVIKAATTVKIEAAATLELKGGAMVDVKGAMVKLNNGSQPVARVGDPVAPNGPIANGNPTVMA